MELRLTRRNARKKSNETDDAFPVRMERAFILVLLLSLSFPLKVVAGGPFRELFFCCNFRGWESFRAENFRSSS